MRTVQIDLWLLTVFGLGFSNSDFRQCLKSELSGNGAKASCLNTKPVWYSDIHCMYFYSKKTRPKAENWSNFRQQTIQVHTYSSVTYSGCSKSGKCQNLDLKFTSYVAWKNVRNLNLSASLDHFAKTYKKLSSLQGTLRLQEYLRRNVFS